MVYLIATCKQQEFALFSHRNAWTDAVKEEDNHYRRQASERGQDSWLHSHHCTGSREFEAFSVQSLGTTSAISKTIR